MTENEKDESFINECKCCFLNWTGVIPDNLCAVCKENYADYQDNPNIKLKRQIEILEHTTPRRFPEIVKSMFHYFEDLLDLKNKREDSNDL